jgi:hypothetical protein
MSTTTDTMSKQSKRGKKPSPGKLVLMKACSERGICKTGSIRTLIERLQSDDIKKLGSMDKSVKLSKKLKKATKSPNSSPQKPLHISAKEYVEKFCDGDLSKARAEWWAPANNVQKGGKWMIPDIRGSKAGPIIRWVRATKNA